MYDGRDRTAQGERREMKALARSARRGSPQGGKPIGGWGLTLNLNRSGITSRCVSPAGRVPTSKLGFNLFTAFTLSVIAAFPALGQTTQPSYFTLGLCNYNAKGMPGVAVGVNAADKTFIVATLQQPLYANSTGKVDFEAWSHFAQSGRLGLWAGAGVGIPTTNTGPSTASGGSVTFQAALSFRIAASWFAAGGVRASAPMTSGGRLSTDKFLGVGIEFK